jgi:hypothetical protein
MKKLFTTFSLFAFVLVCASSASAATNYNPRENPPTINPADFTTEITNPYFSLPIGKKLVYEAETKDGLEEIVIMVPGWTKTVQGVETLVFWDRVYLEGELIEDTRDYLAQHKKTGDLWYFGEHVDNYEDGKLADHDGSWFAGVDGAVAGIWVLANPQVGDYFMNELLLGEAEDESEIVGVNETVATPMGTFTQCVKSLDGSPLFEAKAYTYHCKDSHVQNTVFEEEFPNWPDKSELEQVYLVEQFARSALSIPLPSAYAKEGVVSASNSGDSEKEWFGGNEREDTDDEENENSENEEQKWLGLFGDENESGEKEDGFADDIIGWVIGIPAAIGALVLAKKKFGFKLVRQPKEEGK